MAIIKKKNGFGLIARKNANPHLLLPPPPSALDLLLDQIWEDRTWSLDKGILREEDGEDIGRSSREKDARERDREDGGSGMKTGDCRVAVVGNAFGTSSGTICLSGLLIVVVRVVRAIVDSASQEDVPGFVNLVLRCCVNMFLSAIDFLNKFTINFAAITGEAYCSSARMTYELLRRNLLSAVFVETISSRLLVGIVFVLSAIYAIVTWAILKGVSDLGNDSYIVAALAWLLLILVLGYFVHVLDNVIETVYICYAIDRDRGEVCKQEVHEVYVHLPISRNHRPSLINV
uniref:Choline transporter-like protein n=1 Tax=Cannabis sativa TaxID=3483 RepID=A0A803PWK9_CANSA